MKEKLLELHKHAYVPISNYPVSCVLKTSDGFYFAGVNVEDASTRAGTCAERNAIFILQFHWLQNSYGYVPNPKLYYNLSKGFQIHQSVLQ